MESIQYIGEHLLPGKLGHLALVIGFVSSILSFVAYSFATQNRENQSYFSWKKIGRGAFWLHGLSILVVIALIFHIMINHYFEYQYVWAHSSEDLPFKYIASAFWEGQEGSFLLWMFWHIILGFILIFKAGKWEAPVLATVALIQVTLATMLQGYYIEIGNWSYRLGLNPFLLLRDTMDAPIFNNAEYLKTIDGNGLNALLQNYWMTIHPPTLFLGFASTAVPFSYAIAGLWTGEHKAWLKPALPWALFSAGILGTGILMGGAWAYEALSFGGYWAWDPVENASLVPWLILLGGIHTNLIAKATGHSIRSTYVFYLMTFVFIVYSTFLTRSGVLGDTSVHAFVELGMETHLLAFLLFFVFLSLGMYFYRIRSIPNPRKEEAASSKEFWMFIGSLVFMFSSILIILPTSLPVYNKIRQSFDPGFLGEVITDPVAHYNKYQLWIAIFIGILSGISQFLRYREINFAKHRKKLLVHLAMLASLTLLLTFLGTMWIDARAWQYKLLLFAAIFTVLSNLDYLLLFAKDKPKSFASVLSHLGFGLMIIGILASGLNKHYISNNEFAQRGLMKGFTEEEYKRNVILLKDKPLYMNGYFVTYTNDTIYGHRRDFDINFQRKNEAGEVIEEFNLQPHILYDMKSRKIAAVNPSTKRYWNKDIFTHIPSLPSADTDPEIAKQLEDSLDYNIHYVQIGDTLRKENYILIVDELVESATHEDYDAQANDLSYGVKLTVFPKKFNERFELLPVMALRQTMVLNFGDVVQGLELKVKFADEALEQLFIPESELNYEKYILKKGESISYDDYIINFESFNLKPEHPAYTAQENDIAVGANLVVKDQEGNTLATPRPLYLIRGKDPFNFKEEVLDLGLHFRFIKINPSSEEVEILIGKNQSDRKRIIPLAIAENLPRTDWIGLEAIVFPGINYFWIGTVLMMLGLFWGMFVRRKENRQRNENEIGLEKLN